MNMISAAFVAGALSFATIDSRAASPMDSIAWTKYDNFAGPTLNGGLWSVEGGGLLNTGTAGLTLSPLVSVGSVDQRLVAALPIANGSFFAAEVPFSTTGRAGVGGEISFGIALRNISRTQEEAIWWGNVSGFSLDGPVVTGNIFASDLTTGSTPLTFSLTNATQGTLGILYQGEVISTYFNVGAGWQQLGIPVSTNGWGSLEFELGASTRVVPSASSFFANVPLVQVSQLPPIPEPATAVLILAGLAVIAAWMNANPRDLRWRSRVLH